MKVFLSSTAQDLVDHRKIADDTILRLSQEAVVMERFGPLPGDPVAECERKAADSDLVVCIVAHRYGFIPEKGKGSITRREVEAAKAVGRDVLVWIVADDHPWTQKKEQDLLDDPTVLDDEAKVAEVAAGVSALRAFKTWLRKTFTCEMFTTPDDLGRKISIALQTYSPGKTAHAAPAAPKRGEIRIVHALQPAPHFHGRDILVKELSDWVADLASPDRVWALVAAGGTGKTAIAERVLRDMKPGEANVLIWSFYVKPDADAFLRECNHLFLGEDEGPAGGRLERLERGLRDGRPHLIVLDGLERVQEDAGTGRVRGEISDQTLKLLLRALAAGLGRARALVTSRFPLIDLQDWTRNGYRDTRLDDLSPEAAAAVLRGWDVKGDDAALRAAAAQVGHHALSVAVIGSYLKSFANGNIAEVASFDLDAVTGEDPKAAKLARVLASYAEKLPAEERELLARLSVFARGVTLELLGIVIDAGGEVAGLLVQSKPRLVKLLASLKARGLVFEYRSDTEVTWTAHPFLREKFRELLGIPAEKVFDVLARSLGVGLETRPEAKPSAAGVLDRYERLIEATRLAGREQEAFDLYLHGLGEYRNLGWVLGEYQRGYRVLAGFSTTGRPEDLGATLDPLRRTLLAANLGLFAYQLGRQEEAWALRQMDDEWTNALGNPDEIASGLLNSSQVAFTLGRLSKCRALCDFALATVDKDPQSVLRTSLFSQRAIAAHALGDLMAARADFASATALEKGRLLSLRGAYEARHIADLGDIEAARSRCAHGLDAARQNNWNDELPWFQSMLARLDLATGSDPTVYIQEVHAWTSRTGEMQFIIEAHLLTALHFLASGDPQAALGEAEAGLLHAVACGYSLLRIELLVAMARIRLAWPDPPKAIQSAREALDLAADKDCQYAWGEAEAAQVWGEAYLANHEPTFATRAFARALEVRTRIEHPGIAETGKWLARAG